MVNHKRKYYRAALEKEVIFSIIPCVKKESNRRAFLPVGCSCGGMLGMSLF